jgi:hypothetical protein
VERDNLPTPIRTFYRIVWTDPPTREDALSHVARNVPVHVADEEAQRLATGISVFRTVSQARKNAQKRPPWLGRGFIARITIPPEATVLMERTTRTAGHYTLWAEPEDILRWIDLIEPVTSVGNVADDL